MVAPVLMPKFGQTMTEGAVESWEIQEGDHIEKGGILLRVETDKAVLDVEAETSGYLLKIVVPPGKMVPCGEVIGYLGDLGETVP
jgi:pyruvate/2-oxoglutarate dehydrogenase complex dihydrolipoamide acyltransferase (E2) component